MPYPDVSCDQVELPGGCCQTLAEQGAALLGAIAAPVLNCQLPTPCCGSPLRGFVSLGRPETWQSDYVAVWLNGVSYSTGSIRGTGGMVERPVLRGEWQALLWESCYPGLIELSDEKMATPTDDQFHAANLHAYAHGEAMLRGIMSYATSSYCGGFALRGFGPATPENYSAGWIAGIALDLPF